MESVDDDVDSDEEQRNRARKYVKNIRRPRLLLTPTAAILVLIVNDVFACDVSRIIGRAEPFETSIADETVMPGRTCVFQPLYPVGLHDGTGVTSCHCNGKPAERECYYGIHSFDQFLLLMHSFGVVASAYRSISHKKNKKKLRGWFHSTRLDISVCYAGPTVLRSETYGSCYCRLVVIYGVDCCNVARTGRFNYTKEGCLRYRVLGVLVVPDVDQSLACFADPPWCFRWVAAMEWRCDVQDGLDEEEQQQLNTATAAPSGLAKQ